MGARRGHWPSARAPTPCSVERSGEQALVRVPGVRGQEDGARPRARRTARRPAHPAGRCARSRRRVPASRPQRSTRTAAMRSPAWPSQPGGPSPGRAWAPARAASSASASVSGVTSRFVPARQRDGPLRVGAQRQAGHVEDRGLLLDAARIGDDDGRAADEREEVEVAERVDDDAGRAPPSGRPRRACARPRGWSGRTMGRRRVAARSASTSARGAPRRVHVGRPMQRRDPDTAPSAPGAP